LSYSQKDALTHVAPSALPLLLSLHRRRLSLPVGSHPAKGRPPLLVAGLAAGGSPLRAPCSRPPLRAPRCKRVCPRVIVALTGYCACERRRPPLRAGSGSNRSPRCRGPWPWVAGPTWGLAVVGRPSSSLPSLRKRSKNT
ncbi:hypothetical protein BHM03_00056608, partial [Ensete ventricosum]